jgi:hypothetical protein
VFGEWLWSRGWCEPRTRSLCIFRIAFDRKPFPTQFFRNCAGRVAAGKWIEDHVAGVGQKMKDRSIVPENEIVRWGERKHDQFEGPLIELLSKTRYAKTHLVSGFDGAVKFFQRCRAITDVAFSRLTIPKLAIEYSARDWRSYERQITDFLGLPEMPPIPEHIEQPSRFLGTFRDPTSEAEIVVVALNAEPRSSRMKRLRRSLGHLVYSLYYRFDRKVIGSLLRIRKDAFEPIDLSAAGRPRLGQTG